jgi:hypothetical protein
VLTGADISTIKLQGTDATSALSLAVKKDTVSGDGLVTIGEIDAAAPLKSITATVADLVAGGLVASGGVQTLMLGNLTHGEILIGGSALTKTAITLAHAADGTLIQAAGQISALTALSLGADVTSTLSTIARIMVKAGALSGDVSAPGVGSIAVIGGNLSGSITAPSIGSISVKGGNFSGLITSTTEAANLGRTLALKSLNVLNGDVTGDIHALGAVGAITVKSTTGNPGGNVTGATIYGSSIAGLNVTHNLASSRILAGADLGADGVFGGGDDTFTAGSINSVRIGGNVSGASVIAAGLASTNGTFKDGDDTIIGGIGSVVSSFTVLGTADADSYFAAGLFKSAKINAVKIVPATDARFKVG